MKTTPSIWIDPAGCATIDDMPRVSWHGDTPDAAALARVLAEVDGDVSIGWDPMDAVGLAMLATLGFSPAGTAPWRPMGASVHWVTGYEDATGAVLDLIRSTPCSTGGGC
ncbi:MAG: hypothetical protein MK074_08900 [Phycisphaerales bacterium]|nr:hypothetical protein [Phycisphaerales bacterium]